MEQVQFQRTVFDKDVHRKDGQNPGFYCRDYIETNGHVNESVCSCKEQCNECVDVIIRHHANKVKSQSAPQPEKPKEQ